MSDDLLDRINEVLDDGMSEIYRQRTVGQLTSTVERAVGAMKDIVLNDSALAAGVRITHSVDGDTLTASITIDVRTQRGADRLANRLEDVSKQEHRT